MSDQNSDPSRPFDPPVAPTAPPTAPPAAPPAPPAPPAAPEPQRPDVPQYGEYAAVAPNPYGVPGYPAATAPAAVPAAAPAPVIPAYGTPAYLGAPAYAPVLRKRRTWDIVLTSILLVLGLIGLSFGLFYSWAFSNPDFVDGALAQQGLSGKLAPGAFPVVVAISHIVLYLLALGLSIPLLIRGKTVVFWIPLVIGVIAAIIFWVGLGVVISSDSSLLNSYVNGS